jgi:hypothetical protein
LKTILSIAHGLRLETTGTGISPPADCYLKKPYPSAPGGYSGRFSYFPGIFQLSPARLDKIPLDIFPFSFYI